MIFVKRLPFYSFLVILVIFEVFYFASLDSFQYENYDPEKAALQQQEEEKAQQEQTFTEGYLVAFQDKSMEWEIWSEQAHKGMGNSEWQLTDVKAKLYSEDTVYSIWGKEGLVDEEAKTMLIKGNVKLVSSNDYIFYTDSLRYDPNLRTILTNDKVSVEGPKEKRGRLYLEGVGLQVNLNNDVMILENEVKGHKPMSGNRVMSITSDKAVMSGADKVASFKNNVVIKVNDMVVRGNLAEFKYRNGRLDQLVMDGGIHMSGENKIGSAGMAIVYFNEDKYVFKKKSFVTQGQNELIGDEIIVYDGGKRIQVRNGKAEYHSAEKNQ